MNDPALLTNLFFWQTLRDTESAFGIVNRAANQKYLRTLEFVVLHRPVGQKQQKGYIHNAAKAAHQICPG